LESHSQEQLFQSAAGSVRRRVASVRFARWLRAGHSVVGAVALAAILFARRSLIWREGEIWLVLGLVALWILIGFVFSIVRRPDTFDSLLLLDRIGGWKDRFSSAWAFLSGCGDDDGKKLHIMKASALITEATFPISARTCRSRRFASSGLFPFSPSYSRFRLLGAYPVDQRDLELSDEMKDTAALQSDELERQAKQVKNLDSLGKDEREELEQLRVEVQEIADRLADPDDLTAGEMLEALEERARAAEKLAEKLGVR
jgi:hypothetical protein